MLLFPTSYPFLLSSLTLFQLLSQVVLDDPNAPTILAQTGFPSPWQTLKSALQWYIPPVQGLLFSESLTVKRVVYI